MKIPSLILAVYVFVSLAQAPKILAGDCLYLKDAMLDFVIPYKTSFNVETPANKDPNETFDALIDSVRQWLERHDGIKNQINVNNGKDFAAGGQWFGRNTSKPMDLYVETIRTENPKSWAIKFKNNSESDRTPLIAWETNIALTLLDTGSISLSLTMYKGTQKGNTDNFNKEYVDFKTPLIVRTIIQERTRWVSFSSGIRIDTPFILRERHGNALLELIKRQSEIPIVLVMQNRDGNYPLDGNQFLAQMGGAAMLVLAPFGTIEELRALPGTNISDTDRVRIYFGRESIGFRVKDVTWAIDDFSRRVRNLLVSFPRVNDKTPKNFEDVFEIKTARHLQDLKKIAENADDMGQKDELIKEFELENMRLTYELRKLRADMGELEFNYAMALDAKRGVISEIQDWKQNSEELRKQILELQKAKLVKTTNGGSTAKDVLLTRIKTASDLIAEYASRFSDKITFTKRAQDAAKEMNEDIGPNFQKLWDGLSVLVDVYYDEKIATGSGSLENRVNAGIGAKGLDLEYSLDEGGFTQNMTKAIKDRKDIYQGQEIQAWEHLKGHKIRTHRFTIYFYWDAIAKKIVVSSFPDHLFSASSKGL